LKTSVLQTQEQGIQNKV